MQRLSGTDALFLSAETPAWHQHVGALYIVDPAESERFSFEEVRRTTLERLAFVPKFRWKLKDVPLHLDRPVWVEDKDFDIDRHLRRVAVPPPGGRREVGDLLGMFMGYQLDRRHPLWETWYIDGVVGGQVAIVTKVHHSVMDGVTGAALADQLLDVERNPPPREPPPAAQAAAGPAEPSELELLARAILATVQTPGKLLQYALRGAQRGLTILRQRNEHPFPMGVAGPCFNRDVGPRRKNAFSSVALADVRAVKDALGVKVNDVVLALASGTLRAHMLRHGEMPHGPLVTGVPLSTRIGDEQDASNKVAMMQVTLATDVEDPVERLRAIHASSQSSKELTQAVRARTIQSVGEVAPPLLLNLASRAAWAANISRHAPVFQNVLVSNVPGPPFPLYMAGAQLAGLYAASVLWGNTGLNITVVSYMDRVDFGITGDPDLVDDPWGIAEGIPEALTELMEAAGLGKPTPVADPFDR